MSGSDTEHNDVTGYKLPGLDIVANVQTAVRGSRQAGGLCVIAFSALQTASCQHFLFADGTDSQVQETTAEAQHSRPDICTMGGEKLVHHRFGGTPVNPANPASLFSTWK